MLLPLLLLLLLLYLQLPLPLLLSLPLLLLVLLLCLVLLLLLLLFLLPWLLLLFPLVPRLRLVRHASLTPTFAHQLFSTPTALTWCVPFESATPPAGPSRICPPRAVPLPALIECMCRKLSALLSCSAALTPA